MGLGFLALVVLSVSKYHLSLYFEKVHDQAVPWTETARIDRLSSTQPYAR